MGIVGYAIRNARLTLSIMIFFLIAGRLPISRIPKEAEPDIQIPIIYVSLAYQGISPEDFGAPAAASGRDPDEEPFEHQGNALGRLSGRRLRADRVQCRRRTFLRRWRMSAPRSPTPSATCRRSAEEPTINEVNLSEFPVLVVTLAGDVPERSLTAAARELRDRIEEVPGVLEAALQGAREDLVEVIIDPVKLSSYGLQLDQLIKASAPRTAWLPPAISKARRAATPSRCRR